MGAYNLPRRMPSVEIFMPAGLIQPSRGPPVTTRRSRRNARRASRFLGAWLNMQNTIELTASHLVWGRSTFRERRGFQVLFPLVSDNPSKGAQ